jgi:hypothetical protein
MMIKRYCVALLAGLLLCPAGAAAQYHDALHRPRLSITPIVGYRIPYAATGELTLYYPNGYTSYLNSREERGGGMVVGADAELRVWGLFGLSASFLHAESAENMVDQTIQAPDYDMDWSGPTRSPNVQFFKLGVVVSLPEPSPDLQRFPIVASVSFGPALVREVQLPDPVPADYPQASPVHWEPVNHYAAHVGGRAVVPLGTRHLALRIGLDDYITFWNVKELNRQTKDNYGGTPDWTYGRYHLLVAHAGISLRF